MHGLNIKLKCKLCQKDLQAECMFEGKQFLISPCETCNKACIESPHIQECDFEELSCHRIGTTCRTHQMPLSELGLARSTLIEAKSLLNGYLRGLM